MELPGNDWYAQYPFCIRPSQDGVMRCPHRPFGRGAFYCGEHGGTRPDAMRKAKQRYILWLIADEPFLNPAYFDVICTIWLKRLTDRMMVMPVDQQLKLLDIAAQLIREDEDEQATG